MKQEQQRSNAHHARLGTRLAATALLVGGIGSVALAQTPVRIATFNVEAVGDIGSAQYEALLDILLRIDADVIAINEVNDSGEAVLELPALAGAAGYSYYVVPTGTNPFGALRNAVLSRYPFAATAIHTSASLSGDVSANDLTRHIVEATLELPCGTRKLTVLTNHLKADTGDDNEFRRAVESARFAQALAVRDAARDAYIVTGDFNEELADVPQFPAVFVSVPGGMPFGWVLGDDLEAMLNTTGIANNPFAFLQDAAGPAMTVLGAWQLDGSETTRPASGRRLDYLVASGAIVAGGYAAEVYDSADEGLPGGLPKTGEPLPADTSLDAADHLLVFADITVPAATPGDFDGDDAVGLADWPAFAECLSGPGGGLGEGCCAGDLTADADVDLGDVAGVFVAFFGE